MDGRYLAGTLDLHQEMLNKPNQDLTIDISVDSDWGGVVDDGNDLRKSTGGSYLCGWHVGWFLQLDTETTSSEQL